MAFRKLRKRAKRGFKKTTRFAKKVNRHPITKSVAQIANLAHLLNVEKKRLNITQSGILVGQVFGNIGGFIANDITPIAPVGTFFNERTGSSIKVVSAYMSFQFWTQTANNHVTRLRIELWKVKGNTTSASAELNELYVNVPSTGITDYNSLRNPDYYGGATKFYTKYVNIPASQFTNQIQIKDVKIPLKLNHHIRYQNNLNTVAGGQILMFIFADSGNTSSITSTVSFIPVVSGLSGVQYNQDIRWYYVDN